MNDQSMAHKGRARVHTLLQCMLFNKQNNAIEFSDLQREKSPTAGAAKLVCCLMANLHFQMLS